jgi:hypothetical protein
MTGLPEFNHPAFNAEATRLRGMGFEVVNPADAPKFNTWVEYMRHDLVELLQKADALVYLPGWENSKGAGIEVYLAHSLGMPVCASDDPLGLLSLQHYNAPARVVPVDRPSTMAIPVLSIPMRDDRKDLS